MTKNYLFVVLLFCSVSVLSFAHEAPVNLSATLTGGATVCQNSGNVTLTFTGIGGTPPYTFNYTINGVTQTPIVSTGNSTSLNVSSNTVGTFIYNLVSVQDSQPPNNPTTVNVSQTVVVTSPPIVDFSFSNNNTCSGTQIQFTSNVTGSGNFSYSWNFGDGSPTSTQQNPSHSFQALGCGTSTFNVTLTVAGGGCTVTRTYSVAVRQRPDIDFTDVNNPFDPFSNCSNATSNSVYNVTVGNASASNCISSYSINWGDGNVQNNISFPISHVYNQVGVYTMTITATGNNGCISTKSYTIKNISNPLGGINSPGSTQNLCAPTPNLQFSISNWGTNSLDTTYTVNYGDGTPNLILTQNQLIASSFYNSANPASSLNYPIPHIYNTSSCPNPSFTVTLDVTNACGTTPFTLGNISVLIKPQADFTAPPVACVNTSVLFTNTTIGGFSQNCNQNAIYTWNFGDGSPTITTGQLSSPQNITHTYTNPGTYTVTLTSQNFCGTTTKTRQICIESPLSPQFNVSNEVGCAPFSITTSNTTNLSNNCTPPTYNWQVTYVAANCGTTSGFSFTGGTNANSASPSFNFTEAGTYTISLTATNTCGPFTTTRTINVLRPPTVELSPIANACGPVTITPNATVNGCAPAGTALTYNWSFPGGTPSSSTSPNPGNIQYTTLGNYTISLSVSNICGTSTVASHTFTITPIPEITNTVLTQTVCSGLATTPVTFTATPAGTIFNWTATGTAGVSGFTPSGTGAMIPSQTITTTNTNPGQVVYVITPTFNGCQGPAVNYTIIVNPAPSITSQPVTSSVCLGGSPTPMTVAINPTSPGVTYQWFSNISNSNTGGTLIPGATNATFIPPASSVGTVFYYAVISVPGSGCNSLTSSTGSVTVEPLPTVTTQPTETQSICVGGVVPALNVSYTGGLGTPTFQWFINTTPTNTGGTAIAGATSSSYTPPVFNTAGTFYYYVQITLSGNGCGSIVSQVATVVVVPDPVIDVQPLASQTQCQGSPATPLEVTVSGGLGSVSYQWYSNTVNNTTTGTAIVGATGSSFTPPTSTVGTLFYYVIATQAAPGCSVTSATAQVQVVPAPTVSTQPLASQTVCLGGTTTPLTVAFINGIGTPTYQWFSNTNNTTTGGTAIADATTNTFTPPSNVEGTVYYYVVITFSSGGCTSATSATAAVTVTPLPEIDTQPTENQSICVGGVVPALIVSYTGGLGTPTYQWFSNTSPSNSGGTAISGATSSNYTPPAFNTTGTFHYYVQISLTGSGCGSIVSQVATVVVVPDPVIDVQPLASQTQCQGSPATPLEVTVSGGLGTVSYQWYSNTINNNTSGTLIAGATSNSFIPPTDVVGTVFYYVIATQAAPGCSVTSATAQVQVVPAPTIFTQPLTTQSVCLGGTTSPLSAVVLNGTGTPTYQWFSNTTNSNNGGTEIPGANSINFNPPSTPQGTIYYYLVITYDSGGCSTITSTTATVTVLPLPEIDTQPTETQSICVGGVVPTLTVAYSGGAGTPSYQWYSNDIQSNTGGLAINGATNSSYTPPIFTTVGIYYFYVEITLNGSGCGSIVSTLAEVNVIPDPVVIQQPLPTQTVCQNTPATLLSVSVAGGINGDFNYQWFVSSTNTVGSGTLIDGANSDSFTPPTDVAGTFYYYSFITQTEESGCSVFSEVGEVIVNLAPEVTNQPDTTTYCLGDTPQPLSFTIINGVGTPNVQWFSNTSASNTGGTSLSGATTATFLPPTNQTGVFYYYAVITFPSLAGDCSTVVTEVAVITINQVPVANDEAVTICSDNPFEVIPVNQLPNILPDGTVYTWNLVSITPPNAVTGASANSNPQSSIGQFLVNTTTNPAVVVYEVTPTSGICVGEVFQVVVTVNPAISPNVVVTNSSCFQINNGTIVTNIVGGIPPYTVTWTGPNGFISSTPSISDLAPGTYTLLIEDTGDCPYTESFEITEPEEISVTTLQHVDITCFGFDNGFIEIQVNGGTLPYSFTWTKNNIFYSNEQNLSNLGPGTYEVSVTDANNCAPALMTYKISEPPILEVSLINQVNVECFGDATGSIEVQAAGGTITGDYTFTWNGPNGYTSNSQNIQNLMAGTYQLVVMDDNECEATLIIVLTQSPEIIISYTTTPISCYGANDATFSVNLSGGVPPFQFTWNNLSTSLNQNNLSAGDYIITVTDNFGCVRIETINIPEAPVFMVNPIVNQISCFGANNGSINLNLTGGIAPVTLQWSDGSTAGLIRNNLPPGTYTAIIADGTPCFITRTFTIIEPQALVISAVLTQPTDCINAASGAINLIVSGGTPPFTYQWSNGVTTEDLTGVVAGNYGVTVTDANGCTISGQFTLIRPNPLVVSVTTQTDADCETREVLQFFIAQASGGVPPYTYQWSSGTVSGVNNQVMQTSINGMVILTVTDALGCTTTFDVNVQNPVIGNPNIATESFGFLTYGIYSVNDPIQFYGNVTGDYLNVIWDFGDGTFSNELNPVHTYELEREYIVTMTVTYPFGCVYVLTISLLIEKGYLLVIPNAFTPNNDGLNDTFRPVSRYMKSVRMDVYDSWGSMIYSETGDSLVGWDGRIKGVNAQNGNYYAVVTAETFYGRIIQQNQTFVLIK